MHAILAGSSFLSRDDGGLDPLFGGTSTSVERVTFVATTKTPEPAAIALVGTGLLATLGVGACRRRRA